MTRKKKFFFFYASINLFSHTYYFKLCRYEILFMKEYSVLHFLLDLINPLFLCTLLLKKLLFYVFQAFRGIAPETITVRHYILMIVIPLILINWVRNLKLLAPLSTIANIVTFASFSIILYYIFKDPAELQLSKRPMVGQVQDFPLFLGTVLFALEAIGVVSNFILN